MPIGKKREEIYSKNLKIINEISFTLREIETIACLVNNRGEKKIATLLSISPSTVRSHTRNIMGKLGCNSRESIIDFFEKSGKARILRQYYIDLLIDGIFKKYLTKIGALFNRKEQILEIYAKERFNIEELPVLQQLQHDLKLTNIILNISHTMEKTKENSIAFNMQLSHSSENISLIFDKVATAKTISFEEGENYYFSVFELIVNVVDKLEISKLLEEFKKDYQAISSSSEKVAIDNTDKITEQLLQPIDEFQNSRNSIIHYSKYAVIVGCFLFAFTYFITNNANDRLIGSNNLNNLKSEQNHFTEILSKFFEGLSVRNLTREEAEKNHSVIKQFDLVIEAIQSDQIHKYFNSNTLDANKLINCLYNLNAISSYILFKEHDAKKAEKILKYAKSLAENYVLSRSKAKINFDDITSDEIYTELYEIKDLPEVYSTTMYFLGRSFIYQKKIELAKKYFELSRDLGKKLGLLTEVLSIINGLAIIKSDQVDLEIKNRNYEQARANLLECINMYEKVREEETEYKKDYRPNNYNPATIVPKKDIHNIIDCNKRIVKLYTKLIGITDNKSEQSNYLDSVSKQLIGTSKSVGMLEILTKQNDVLPRILADSYNSLGYFFLKSYDKHIDFKEFRNHLIEKLNLTDGDDLKIIYQLFDKAKSLSRNTEFSKADACDGLMKVYERLMLRNSTTVEEKKILSIKIQNLKKSMDGLKNNL